MHGQLAVKNGKLLLLSVIRRCTVGVRVNFVVRHLNRTGGCVLQLAFVLEVGSFDVVDEPAAQKHTEPF